MRKCNTWPLHIDRSSPWPATLVATPSADVELGSIPKVEVATEPSLYLQTDIVAAPMRPEQKRESHLGYP